MITGTVIFTMLNGVKIGEDAAGNVYYTEKKARAGMIQRRWVMYKGGIEASKIPPEWHAWLHYTVDSPIGDAKKEWQKPHSVNKTGSLEAYAPSGYDSKGGIRAKAHGDYQAWQPNAA